MLINLIEFLISGASQTPPTLVELVTVMVVNLPLYKALTPKTTINVGKEELNPATKTVSFKSSKRAQPRTLVSLKE